MYRNLVVVMLVNAEDSTGNEMSGQPSGKTRLINDGATTQVNVAFATNRPLPPTAPNTGKPE
jgi:hypothetical protein